MAAIMATEARAVSSDKEEGAGNANLFEPTQAHDGPHHRRQHGFSAEQLYGFGNIAMHNLGGVAGFLQALGDLFSDHY